MKDSLCYIYFSCTVYWNINCWRHMGATSSDVRKYTCIYGCAHNDAWGSPCESTVGCRITVPATFFLTRMAHEHATTWVHETSFCVLFLYGYIYWNLLYIYTYKKTHSATHVHIYTYPTSATLPCWASCLRHPLHSCRMAAWFAQLSRQDNWSRLQMFISLLDSPLTPISHALSAFKKKRARTCT